VIVDSSLEASVGREPSAETLSQGPDTPVEWSSHVDEAAGTVESPVPVFFPEIPCKHNPLSRPVSSPTFQLPDLCWGEELAGLSAMQQRDVPTEHLPLAHDDEVDPVVVSATSEAHDSDYLDILPAWGAARYDPR